MIIFSAVVTLIIGGCIDPIELEINGNPEFLVINGGVTNLDEPYLVTIYKSTGIALDANTIPEPISGAKVSIWSGDGSFL